MLALALAACLLPPPLQAGEPPNPDKKVERIILPRERRPLLFMELTLTDPDPSTPMLVLFHQARSSAGEYRPIVPRLRELGYNCLAVDLSSGGESREVKNRTARRAAESGRNPTYLDTLPDIEDALRWAREKHAHGPLLAWGSSFSASLALITAASHPELVDGVIAFSPGEYFVTLGKSATWVQESVRSVTCPVFVAAGAGEERDWQPIFAALPSAGKTSFVPGGAGGHGSRALWKETSGSEQYWSALEAFLAQHFPPRAAPRTPPAPPASPAQDGAPELPAFFSEHMLLQRETRTPLWGRAAPGERVEVRASWPGAEAQATTADALGNWRVELATPGAGGPHTLTIAGARGVRVFADVLVGELWLASGQSNMEWTLGPRVGNGVEGWEEAVASAADPLLRLFDVENALAAAPEGDVVGRWQAASSASAAPFSASAYFFARALRRELGVPVGVISADWGGTPAEAWTSAAGLASFPEFAPALARLAAHAPATAEAEYQARRADYWRAAREQDARRGLAGAELAATDVGAWSTVTLPATWEQHGLAAFDGLAWYRRTLELPAGWEGRELVLELGPIDDRDTVYWNGTRIGGQEDDGAWQTPRSYRVPAELAAKGPTTLAVRVLDTGGLGGFTGSAEAMALRPAAGEAAPLTLAGSWRWKAGTPLDELGWPPAREPFDAHTPSALWNGMIAPLSPCALRGVIWYQGESNIGRAEQYERLFPAMIQDWRRAFGRAELPFFFVQIAPFGYGGDTGQAARLRDAQRRTLALPGTGMAVTMDIGDPADIHPLKKREVGERLARWALARCYGREIECAGPLFAGARAEGATLRVEFAHAAGLTSRGAPIRHLTLAGADRVFHAAEGRIQGETLWVTSPAVAEPVAVRFGWGAADETNLWNGDGLPAASFRSDDWP